MLTETFNTGEALRTIHSSCHKQKKNGVINREDSHRVSGIVCFSCPLARAPPGIASLELYDGHPPSSTASLQCSIPPFTPARCEALHLDPRGPFAPPTPLGHSCARRAGREPPGKQNNVSLGATGSHYLRRAAAHATPDDDAAIGSTTLSALRL